MSRRPVRPGFRPETRVSRGMIAFVLLTIIAVIAMIQLMKSEPQTYTQREVPVLDHANATPLPAVPPTPPQQPLSQNRPTRTEVPRRKSHTNTCSETELCEQAPVVEPKPTPKLSRHLIGPPEPDDYEVIEYNPDDPGCPESDELALEEVRQPQPDEIVRQREQARHIIGPPE